MDNCSGHADDMFNDPSDQVKVTFLPPNCTSVFQPMDCGVIAMIKKNYHTALLLKMLEIYDDMLDLQEQSKGRPRGTRGIDEGYPPHLCDCMDILFEVSKEIVPEKIHNCWHKSTLLEKPPSTSVEVAAEEDAEMDVDVEKMDNNIKELDENDDAMLNAMTELVDKVRSQKKGSNVAEAGNCEMNCILDELMKAVDGIDISDLAEKKKLINEWVELEESDFCAEALTVGEDDLSPEVLLNGHMNEGGINDASDDDDDDDDSVIEVENDIKPASKEDIDAVNQALHDLASCLEKLEGLNICAGKVRDAANSSAATWRKLEIDRVALK